MEKIIEVNGLKKSFGDVKAVKGINFYVDKGSLFAFLGENGAGKSVTIDMLCTLLKPDEGSVVIDGKTLGKNDNDIRKSIGIVFQDSVLDSMLTVEENLNLRASLYEHNSASRKKAVEFAAETTEVTDFFKRPYGKLSGGQRRRVDIARALLNTPKILFLDEPSTGLDPKTRQLIWQTMKTLRKQTDMTIFLTTHYMEEAAQADYITIMSKGEILAKGTPMELKAEYASDLLKIKLKPNVEESVFSDLKYRKKGEYYELPIGNTVESIAILNKLENNIDNFEVLNGTMDNVFINVTGKENINDLA